MPKRLNEIMSLLNTKNFSEYLKQGCDLYYTQDEVDKLHIQIQESLEVIKRLNKKIEELQRDNPNDLLKDDSVVRKCRCECGCDEDIPDSEKICVHCWERCQ